MKKIPVTAYPVKPKDLKAAFFPEKNAMEDFASAIAPFIGNRNAFFTNSGAAAFYLILESLKELSPDRDEVVLPAYTAPVLAVAVRKAGLKTVLSDISLEDFNMDIDALGNAVTEKTICIAAAHMFGIPAANITVLKNKFKGVFIVEDCAQAMDSWINEMPVGSFGDFSFYSFNRGKNLPTYGGGAMTAASRSLEQLLKKKADALKGVSVFSDVSIALKMLLFSLAVDPAIYGTLYPLIAIFKSDSVPVDIEIKKYSIRQAAAGASLIADFRRNIELRRDNGIKLIRGLEGLNGLIVPVIKEGVKPAFNRLPVMFKDIDARSRARTMLDKAGIETSNMYNRPIHHIFELGYKKESFNNAVRFARGLMTLPSHPLLYGDSVEKMVSVIREVLK